MQERADEAVKRMRTRTDGKDGGSAAKKKLKYTVYDLIHEDNELEREEKATERREKLEERRREREQEREDRHKEREEDRTEREAARAHQPELAKPENERYAIMLKLIMLNKSGGGSTVYCRATISKQDTRLALAVAVQSNYLFGYHLSGSCDN